MRESSEHSEHAGGAHCRQVDQGQENPPKALEPEEKLVLSQSELLLRHSVQMGRSLMRSQSVFRGSACALFHTPRSVMPHYGTQVQRPCVII